MVGIHWGFVAIGLESILESQCSIYCWSQKEITLRWPFIQKHHQSVHDWNLPLKKREEKQEKARQKPINQTYKKWGTLQLNIQSWRIQNPIDEGNIAFKAKECRQKEDSYWCKSQNGDTCFWWDKNKHVWVTIRHKKDDKTIFPSQKKNIQFRASITRSTTLVQDKIFCSHEMSRMVRLIFIHTN